MAGPNPSTSEASRYRLIRRLKSGGTAEVFEAAVSGQSGFERRVAIKRLLPEFSSDESLLRSFIDEARIVSQLHHANVVGVSDLGVMDDRPFLVLELVKGEDLFTLVDRSGEGGRDIPPWLALHVATEVAHALAYAHTARDHDGRKMRVVHRDVSPENILVSWEGDVKLTDFGIAYALRRLERTQVGVGKGKPLYMAPEQQKGDDVDGRADVFSLGCVLHWLVAGKSPLEDTEGLVPGEVVISDSLPDDVEEIVRRATRFSRDDRYRTAGEMAGELGRALAGRLGRDPRSALLEWLAPLREDDQQHELKRSLGVDIVAAGLFMGLPRFQSIAKPQGSPTPGPAPIVEAETLVDESFRLPPIEPRDMLLVEEKAKRRPIPIWALLAAGAIGALLGLILTKLLG